MTSVVQPKAKPKTHGNAATEADNNMLYVGATQTQLVQIFDMDPKTIRKRVAANNVRPNGMRNGSPIYRIKDIAPYLVKPAGDIEFYIKNMNHTDLPPILTKEFWNAKRARQAFEKEEGELITKAEFRQAMAEVFSNLRQTLLLLGDTVDGHSALNDKQREIIQGVIDGGLQSLRVSLLERYADAGRAQPDDEDDHGQEYEGVFEDLDDTL
jgi:hypothetical protein